MFGDWEDYLERMHSMLRSYGAVEVEGDIDSTLNELIDLLRNRSKIIQIDKIETENMVRYGILVNKSDKPNSFNNQILQQ